MVINQIHAIGDLLYLEPMYRHFWETQKKKPIVPVRDHLFWISEYIDSAIFVKMSEFKMDYEDRRTRKEYLPTRWANQIIRGVKDDDYTYLEYCMQDKYTLAGLDPNVWKTLQINFNQKRGYQLLEHLNIGPFDDYVLVNNHSQAGEIDIKVPGHRVIKMSSIPGYTVLDWYMVMYHARENHHVSTSTIYILQAIYNSIGLDNKVVFYPRPNFDGIRGIKNINPSYNFEKYEL